MRWAWPGLAAGWRRRARVSRWRADGRLSRGRRVRARRRSAAFRRLTRRTRRTLLPRPARPRCVRRSDVLRFEKIEQRIRLLGVVEVDRLLPLGMHKGVHADDSTTRIDQRPTRVAG